MKVLGLTLLFHLAFMASYSSSILILSYAVGMDIGNILGCMVFHGLASPVVGLALLASSRGNKDQIMVAIGFLLFFLIQASIGVAQCMASPVSAFGGPNPYYVR